VVAVVVLVDTQSERVRLAVVTAELVTQTEQALRSTQVRAVAVLQAMATMLHRLAVTVVLVL
jgi:hypothetical protein